MLNLLEYLIRRLRQLRPDPILPGLIAGLAVVLFLWKKGKQLLLTLLALAFLLRQLRLAAQMEGRADV